MKTITLLLFRRQLVTGQKREKLLDRSFDEWECFRSEMAGVVVDALLEITPGYKHPEMHKAEERHQRICREHLKKCLDI